MTHHGTDNDDDGRAAPDAVTRRILRDRRHAMRVPVRWGIELSAEPWQAPVAWTLNVSEGGMSCQVHPEARVGQELAVTISLPTGRLLKVSALVRHVRAVEEVKTGKFLYDQQNRVSRYQVGLEFENVPTQERHALQQSLEELARAIGAIPPSPEPDDR